MVPGAKVPTAVAPHPPTESEKTAMLGDAYPGSGSQCCSAGVPWTRLWWCDRGAAEKGNEALTRSYRMTSQSFRRLALTMPETLEVGHMGHPDLRIGGKIFATLGYPDERWGMVKLTPEQQEAFVAADPAVYAPVQGGWGQP